MRTGRCFIVGAGDFCARGLRPGPGDLLIAADGGCAPLLRMGLRPRLLVGDMDSLGTSAPGVPRLRFPVRKDETDLALSVRAGLARDYRRFLIYGASGGRREDHFLAALQLMAGLSEEGLRLRLVAPRYDVWALHDGRLLIPTVPGATVSVFSHSGQSLGVTLRGLDYPAEGLRLTSARPLGVSNRALGRSARIRLWSGELTLK